MMTEWRAPRQCPGWPATHAAGPEIMPPPPPFDRLRGGRLRRDCAGVHLHLSRRGAGHAAGVHQPGQRRQSAGNAAHGVQRLLPLLREMLDEHFAPVVEGSSTGSDVVPESARIGWRMRWPASGINGGEAASANGATPRWPRPSERPAICAGGEIRPITRRIPADFAAGRTWGEQALNSG